MDNLKKMSVKRITVKYFLYCNLLLAFTLLILLLIILQFLTIITVKRKTVKIFLYCNFLLSFRHKFPYYSPKLIPYLHTLSQNTPAGARTPTKVHDDTVKEDTMTTTSDAAEAASVAGM